MKNRTTGMRALHLVVRAFLAALVSVLFVSALPVSAAEGDDATPDEAETEQPSTETPLMKVLDERLPIELPEPTVSSASAWLIADSANRVAYLLFEKASPATMWIRSFDLDTLEEIRTEKISGVIPIGQGAYYGNIIHAVDPETGRVFLAVAGTRAGNFDFSNTRPGTTPDTTRIFSKVLVIDGAKFNVGAPETEFSSDIVKPAVHAGALAVSNLRGMAFTRPEGSTGKLRLLWSAPSPATVPNADPGHRQIYDHSLAQWDAESGAGDWIEALTACQRAPLTGSGQPDRVFYQLGILSSDDAVHVPCQASHGVAQAVRVPLANGAPDRTQEQAGFPLPRRYGDAMADQGGQRLYFRAVERGTSWWVFDADTSSWVGGLGASSSDWATQVAAGIDQSTGRFYNLVPHHKVEHGVDEPFAVQGGFRATDGRLSPEVPQFQTFLSEVAYPGQMELIVDPADESVNRPRRVFVRRGHSVGNCFDYPNITNAPCEPQFDAFYTIIEDGVPVVEKQSLGDIDALKTTDVDEQDGVTEANYDGAGSGYGMRAVLTGGLSAATSRDLEAIDSACLPSDRELVAGAVEAAQLSNIVASARAVGLHADEASKNDLATPISRCAPDGSPDSSGLNAVGAGKFGDYAAECAGDESSKKAPADPGRHFAAEANCAHAKSSVDASATGGLAPLSGVPVPQVRVASSSSTVDVTRDPDRGIVTKVVSMARGIEIEGLGSIGVIRTEAETVAKGRPGTAKTTFTRTACGVALPGANPARCFSEDEMTQLVNGLNRAMSGRAQFRLRQPDAEYAAGSPGGYQAAIQRDADELFTDGVISRDASKAVPGLELVFYRDDPSAGAGRQIFQFAGVQASSSYGISCLLGPAQPEGEDDDSDGTDGGDGDETTTTTSGASSTTTTVPSTTTSTTSPSSTTTTIADGEEGESPAPVTGCAEPAPSQLAIALIDEVAEPLAGGVFEVHHDLDADGILGADDAMVEGGTCVTAEDGIGDCLFEELEPGAYVVEQTSAPPGYAKAPLFPHVVEPATDYLITFTNLPSVAGVNVSLTDDSAEAKPLAGGVFELYADDGDELLGDADVLYATCTTDDSGVCELEVALDDVTGEAVDDALGELVDAVCIPLVDAAGCVLPVPLGAYVVHQSAAPAGYAPAGDVGFTFDQPGQVASLAFVNGIAGSDGTVVGVAEGNGGTPAIPATPPTEVIEWDEGTGIPQPIVESKPLEPPKPSLADRASDALTQVMRVPLEAFRFLFNNPREVGLMAAVWVLLFLPCYLAERRRVLDGLRTYIAPSEAA